MVALNNCASLILHALLCVNPSSWLHHYTETPETQFREFRKSRNVDNIQPNNRYAVYIHNADIEIPQILSKLPCHPRTFRTTENREAAVYVTYRDSYNCILEYKKKKEGFRSSLRYVIRTGRWRRSNRFDSPFGVDWATRHSRATEHNAHERVQRGNVAILGRIDGIKLLVVSQYYAVNQFMLVSGARVEFSKWRFFWKLRKLEHSKIHCDRTERILDENSLTGEQNSQQSPSNDRIELSVTYLKRKVHGIEYGWTANKNSATWRWRIRMKL